jgi:hypothetical protein
MPRIPKGQPLDTAKTIRSWFRASTNFIEIERALRAKLKKDHRENIEASMAFAVEGERGNGGTAFPPTEKHRSPSRISRKGRPRKNDNWIMLIKDLAGIFEEVRGERPTISLGIGTPTGIFFSFVWAVFAEIPIATTPTESATGDLVKRALKERRSKRSRVIS